MGVEVHNLAQKSEALAVNAQLRLDTVWTALDDLKRRKKRMETTDDRRMEGNKGEGTGDEQ